MSGTPEASGPSYGSESSFCKAAMAWSHKEVAQRENHRSTIERRAQLELYSGGKRAFVTRYLMTNAASQSGFTGVA